MSRKIKVGAADLRVGMYVAELDRPWLESPFLFQGFVIDGEELLQQVRRTCDYVYVDQDAAATLASPARENAAAATPAPSARAYLRDVDARGESQVRQILRRELDRTRRLHASAKSYIDRLFHDVRIGNSVDTEAARSLVRDMVESIIVSPEALLWFTHLKQKDEYTAYHSINVCVLSLTFARGEGVSETELHHVGLGALMHDVGKMKVPATILKKPGKLDDAEWTEMKKHPEYGHALLRDKPDIPPQVLDVVLSHHEHDNGSGYPRGLTRDNIGHFAKLVAIADVYDALTSGRVYRNAISPHEALKRMYHWVPDRFDKSLIERFIRCLGIYPVGSIVRLSTGYLGVVVSISDRHHLKPVVLLTTDPIGRPLQRRRLINLASPAWRDQKIEIQRVIEPGEAPFDLERVIIEESLQAQVAGAVL
jgi:HD-GYP domain-containing protein (c-di-GMP phosphodiesterase class II)